MEDLIRRSDVIKGAKWLHNLFSSPFYNRDRVEMIEAYFNDIPSADRPQGEWIDKAISIIDDMQREGIVDYQQAWEFRMRARMKGADDDQNIQSADE